VKVVLPEGRLLCLLGARSVTSEESTEVANGSNSVAIFGGLMVINKMCSGQKLLCWLLVLRFQDRIDKLVKFPIQVGTFWRSDKLVSLMMRGCPIATPTGPCS
jgi:hypothetical protein